MTLLDASWLQFGRLIPRLDRPHKLQSAFLGRVSTFDNDLCCIASAQVDLESIPLLKNSYLPASPAESGVSKSRSFERHFFSSASATDAHPERLYSSTSR